MKLFIAALVCLSATAASAQMLNKPFEPSLNKDTPTVMTQYDKATGEVMGTTTITGGKAYLRDKNGEHYATFIIDKDGTRRMVDVNGNPIDVATIKQKLEDAK
jgi:hypothetical protein